MTVPERVVAEPAEAAEVSTERRKYEIVLAQTRA